MFHTCWSARDTHSQKQGERRCKELQQTNGGREASGSMLVAGRVSEPDSEPILHTQNEAELPRPGKECSHLSPHRPGLPRRVGGCSAVDPGCEPWLSKLVFCSELQVPYENRSPNRLTHSKCSKNDRPGVPAVAQWDWQCLGSTGSRFNAQPGTVG